MSSGDKMAPFLASKMAWVCHVIFFIWCYIYKNYSNVLFNFQAFNEMDENHDGQVSEEEFIEVREKNSHPWSVLPTWVDYTVLVFGISKVYRRQSRHRQ